MPRGFREWDGGGNISAPYYDSRDIDSAARAILMMANWIEDTTVPLNSAKEIARQDMENRFNNQVDPLGKPWEKLTIGYAREKQREVGFITPILSRTKDLRSAAISPNAWFVEGDSVMFFTGGLPDYWEYHQQEGGRYPRFKSMQVSRAKTVLNVGKHALKDKPYGAPVRVMGKTQVSYQDHGMPQRAFIGLSDDAQQDISIMIDRWLSAGLELGVQEYEKLGGGSVRRSTGLTDYTMILPGAGGKPQFRTALGRFGPMA